jgi:(p)ppGpp synthase/HD superfamily hydrolase
MDDATALERAIALATQAHRGQRYPAPLPEPYILHPLRVMHHVDGFRAKTAAILHDVLEDTSVRPDQLRSQEFPDEVYDAVLALTRAPDEPYERYVERVADNELATAVKLADLADNLANNRRLVQTSGVTSRISRYQRAIERLRRPD